MSITLHKYVNPRLLFWIHLLDQIPSDQYFKPYVSTLINRLFYIIGSIHSQYSILDIYWHKTSVLPIPNSISATIYTANILCTMIKIQKKNLRCLFSLELRCTRMSIPENWVNSFFLRSSWEGLLCSYLSQIMLSHDEFGLLLSQSGWWAWLTRVWCFDSRKYKTFDCKKISSLLTWLPIFLHPDASISWCGNYFNYSFHHLPFIICPNNKFSK